MRLFLVLLTLLLLAVPGWADPQDAVMRLKSHGASGTVIYSDGTRSLILSCAHMFLDRNNRESAAMRNKPIVMDGTPGATAPTRLGKTRVLAIDSQLDLSLIEVDIAMPYVAPVAAIPKTGRRLISVGYDDMKWPVTNRPATITQDRGDTTLTREKPWHGRSGGALLDRDTGELVGVVSGYGSGRFVFEIAASNRGNWREIGDGYGVYVSHAAILRFVAKTMNSGRIDR